MRVPDRAAHRAWVRSQLAQHRDEWARYDDQLKSELLGLWGEGLRRVLMGGELTESDQTGYECGMYGASRVVSSAA